MKIKLDENLPMRLASALQARGHLVDTVAEEGLTGYPDQDVWRAVCREERFFITQDLDFSDVRRFAPGSHPGVLLVRLREPSAQALLDKVLSIASDLEGMAASFAVLTDHKLRIKRP